MKENMNISGEFWDFLTGATVRQKHLPGKHDQKTHGRRGSGKKTIAQTKIDEMKAAGYKLAGRTSGLFSFRKGSNLSRKLTSLGLTKDDVVVKAGARAGQRKNDGWELLIFVKE